MKFAPAIPAAARRAPSGRGPVVDWTEITVTSRCNQRCFFCYESARETDADPPAARIRKLLRETRRHARKVVFCGREALLRSDIFELVAYARTLGLQPVVFTNGQALSRAERVARLAEAGCSGVTVSFHFPDAAAFAAGAGVSPRCFERVLAGLRNLREHNRACPDRRLAVSTETDMFSLNAGRLREMRRTLVEALGDSGWSMRLASLLPMPVRDIGLPAVVDSLAARREEVAELVRTQPPGVPLGFVKVPLCLLPEGEEHRSLDVQNFRHGTRMTFNHLALRRIDVDRFSVTGERDLGEPLRRHPYRWVCRTCAVLPLCRFERLSWTDPGFLPDRANRPLPYRAGRKASGPAAGFDLPHRTRSAADVLAPLGTSREAVRRVSAACAAVAGREFPEEVLLRALRNPADGAPALVDAWVEKSPVSAIELRDGRRRLRLDLGAPGVRTEEPCAIVDYLSVRPLDGNDAPRAPLQRALRRLASVPLPAIGGWSADSWFDVPTARRRRAAWRRLGEILWPRIGRIGPWRTAAVRSDPSADVEVQLEHACGTRAELAWRTEEGAPDLPVGLTLRRLDSGAPRADVIDLLESLARKVAGGAAAAPQLPAGIREIALHLQRDRWVAGSLPAAAPHAGAPPGDDELVLRVRRGDDWRVEFHVARTRAGRPVFLRVGALSLWYGQAVLDGPALAWAQMVLAAMRRFRGQPLAAAVVPRWREALAGWARRSSWTRGFRWRLEWRAASRRPAESLPNG